MGHNIRYADYAENVNKKKVQDDWNNYVAHEDWQEGASGASPIRWINQTCDSYEAAENFIKSHDNGWYDCLAVKYRSFSKVKPSAKFLELEERVAKCRAALNEKTSKFHFADVKSEFIGCKNCGSKIAKAFLKRNYCPVCNADMRPASTLSSIEAAQTALKKAEATLKAEREKFNQKCKEKAEIRWLVKIEYHT